MYLKISLLLCSFVQLINAEYHVESVQVVFRHGDRTPRKEELYPKLPYSPLIYERMGFGELTNVGKIREFRIGQVLRERYNELLGEVYYSDEIYAISTDFNRTKMSLDLVLFGLLPKLSLDPFEMLQWLPIPTRYVPALVDPLLFGELCPLYLKELQRVMNTTTYQRSVAKYNNLFKLLADKTGLNMTVNPAQKAAVFYTFLTTQISMHIPIPKWVNDTVWKELESLVAMLYDFGSSTPKLKRLSGGPIIKQFIENLNLNETRQKTPKMFLYSAHDITVASFTRAHNFVEPRVPKFGSSVIFEKLRDANDDVFIRILLWTGVTEKLITYNLPGSTHNGLYPINKYLKFVANLIPSDNEMNCLWDHATTDRLHRYYQLE